MRAAGVEALLVTHLPNLRYLTGYSGTAGAAILSAERCVLVVDFRYATAARELLASRPAATWIWRSSIAATTKPSSTCCSARGSADWHRGGVDDSKRFNWLSATLAATPAA